MGCVQTLSIQHQDVALAAATLVSAARNLSALMFVWALATPSVPDLCCMCLRMCPLIRHAETPCSPSWQAALARHNVQLVLAYSLQSAHPCSVSCSLLIGHKDQALPVCSQVQHSHPAPPCCRVCAGDEPCLSRGLTHSGHMQHGSGRSKAPTPECKALGCLKTHLSRRHGS